MATRRIIIINYELKCYLTYKSNDSRSNPSNILKGILFENSKIEHVETSVGLVGKKFITYNDTI